MPRRIWEEHKKKKKKKKKTERNGQEDNIDDMIERPEFILYDVDDLELRDDNIANL